MKTISHWIAVALLAGSNLVMAQDRPSPAPDGAWRRVGDATPPPDQDLNQATLPPPNYNLPAQLTMKAGTFVTVRLNQPLSSDHNQAGDAFSATLVQPIVVDGVVIAQRGQTIGGRVEEAKKAGRVEGTSRLGIKLTDLTLVDGDVVPIQMQLISRSGGTSQGRDVAAVAGTTALGAAIGAAAGWGTGAAIGAGSGAGVGLLGVLLTRGRPTYIGPESVLTFRVEAPVTIVTDRAPQAFRFVEPNDYNRPPSLQSRGPAPAGPPPPAPYYYGYGYGYPYYPYDPYFYGPRVSFFYGPGFYFRGGHRGFRR